MRVGSPKYHLLHPRPRLLRLCNIRIEARQVDVVQLQGDLHGALRDFRLHNQHNKTILTGFDDCLSCPASRISVQM